MTTEPFMPELGQAVFGNGQMHAIDLNRTIEAGLVTIAEAIAAVRGEDPDRVGLLISNYGCDPYESDVFAMHTYCWCDGDQPGHQDGCPPNFRYNPSGFEVSWYKHVGRGASQSRQLGGLEWLSMLQDCLASLTPDSEVVR